MTARRATCQVARARVVWQEPAVRRVVGRRASVFGEDGRSVTGRMLARVAVWAKVLAVLVVLVEMMVVVVVGTAGNGSRGTARPVVMAGMALARAEGRNVGCRRALTTKRGVARLGVSMAWVEAVAWVETMGTVRHANHRRG